MSWNGSSDQERRLNKMELGSDLEEKLLKLEFESSFGSEYSPADYLHDPFPLHLNPGFDLQVSLKVYMI